MILSITKSIMFSSNMNGGMNSLGAAAASYNMKNSGEHEKQYAWSWRSHDRDQLFHTAAIFHVAVGRGCARLFMPLSMLLLENHTFENTSNTDGGRVFAYTHGAPGA